jgi:hypothetical protein
MRKTPNTQADTTVVLASVGRREPLD